MTTSVLMSDRPKSISLFEKYQILICCMLVLVLTWPFMLVEVLVSRDLIAFEPPMALMILQGFMPGLAAILVAGLTQGREGVRVLLRKILITRVGLPWYLFAIFVMGAVSILAILLTNRFGSMADLPLLSPEMPPSAGPLGILLNVVILFVFSAVFNTEEIAWRGFVLPRLQAKYSALTSSLLLSIPWILFHLPLFFKLGSSQSDAALVSYTVQLVATTILFTWMYNHTRGSILPAWLLHASMNTWTQIFSINSGASNPLLGWMVNVVLLVLAILVVAVYGARDLSRTNARITE